MTNATEGLPDDVRIVAQRTYRSHLELLSSGRIDEWVDLFAEDAVYELPYALDGEPSRLTGKVELKNYMSDFPKTFRIEFVDLRFHETVDPSLVVAEARGQNIHLASGRPYNQTYINVVETRNGRFTHFKDFMNPLVLMKALGLGPAVGR
ncbi:ketosteroid isomerase-like protein [Catenuloplanes nepalensis]|uniref:Ketosteroid isomerase-like protein n=1 Tax=Catenuloplanes nepalensis TaxID=587533 RepID=A0ABT9MS23_9ACTN|nr:nuclear transport factor 2 family protein [Catenuloplanes nepalensis]MDP9794086.1 ketosteroid isomerase-like protein [Catenuloplanes nepalensis]